MPVGQDGERAASGERLEGGGHFGKGGQAPVFVEEGAALDVACLELEVLECLL